jgi:NADH-quinone oxidoreductase subunit C
MSSVPPTRLESLSAALSASIGEGLTVLPVHVGELTVEISAERMAAAALLLRDTPGLQFETCIDVCGVDYLDYGKTEWKTVEATSTGFSRGVAPAAAPSGPVAAGRRFAVVYHLLSVSLNQRLRMRVFCPDDDQPIVDSLTGVWGSADWFERETFDLFGILFKGHPDLRRLLTDYGFIGHPFRKDFPLTGNVEVRYDPEKRRVVYQPVTIDPRILVPKVIRHDNRYDPQLTNAKPNG